MSADNKDYSGAMMKGGLIAGGTIIGFIFCLGITGCIFDSYITRKTAKLLKRSAHAEQFTRDLEAQTQPHEQASQQPPPAPVGDFAGFNFCSSPYSGAQVPSQDTVPKPAHQHVHGPNDRPTIQRRQTIDSVMDTPELRRKPAFTNIAKGERSQKPSLTHPDDFELEEINIHCI